jgi:hypothetical protein
VLPITALLLLRTNPDRTERAIIVLSVLLWLPSPYVLLRGQDIASLNVQLLIHAERILPTVLIFALLLVRAVLLCLRSPQGLRLLSAAP